MKHPAATRVGLLLILTWMLSQARPLQAQRVTAVVPRDTIAARLRELDRIHTPEGIEELEQLDVNGSKQWISIPPTPSCWCSTVVRAARSWA